MRKLADIWHILREILALPKVVISLGTDHLAMRLHSSFMARHPRYKVVRKKTLGVALISMPEDAALCLKGKSRQVMRTNISRARKCGYKVVMFNADERAEEILAVNLSSDERQGREMPSSYTKIETVQEYCASRRRLLGILDSNEVLVAYLEPVESREVVVVSRLLGHRDHLKNGIMYMLLYGCIEYCVKRNVEGGAIHWLMYDMMFGAKPGLRYFKERIGFSAYRVRWDLS